MKAMILAAGLGTRLRPLTNHRPKALVEINGRTLLEITLARLRKSGVDEVIINAHHFADQLIDYLRANDNFGMRLEVSLSIASTKPLPLWPFKIAKRPDICFSMKICNYAAAAHVEAQPTMEAHKKRRLQGHARICNRLLFAGFT